MRLKKIISTAMLMIGVVLVPLSASVSAAPVNVFGGCSGNSSSAICASTGGAGDANSIVKSIVDILIYVSGIIAVIVIIIGGIRYTTSGGDSGQMTSAKNTILYAVIGLVVIVMAYAIVNFVLGAF